MSFTRKIDEVLIVKEINGVVEEGVTYPLKCTLSNETSSIVKYQKNPVGTEVLINEWIGNCIADSIGLTIPKYGIDDGISIESVAKNTGLPEDTVIRLVEEIAREKEQQQ